MLLWNHGTLTLGKSVASAFLTMYFLERACAMQVATLAGGGAIHHASADVQALVARQAKFGKGMVDDLAWRALVRKIDRIDPSYKS
jgi:ribulose-5-phosphate 4-epimerase/fuculose-1-phosphate aldolase